MSRKRPSSRSGGRCGWRGGLLAVANLRGGAEYGEDWHQAGTKTRKQNVFDDFIAAAEWLIAENYTGRRSWQSTGARTVACWWAR